MTIAAGSESGEAIIRYLLANSAAVLAVVPAARIYVGELPLNTAMPAIVVNQIDGIQYNDLANGTEPKLYRDRVQVNVYRGATPGDLGRAGLKPLLTLIRKACQGQRGTISGVHVDSITPEMEGPTIPIQELDIVTRSTDFFVKFVA